ncbi:MAG: hypothetical protein OHK0031_04580 [Anaerolineales bacterium]
MLVIISDLHLIDGTLGVPTSPQTFSLFAHRLRELVYRASWRADGRYRPLESVDILLLGDILDPLQSAQWLQRDPQDTSYIRPWHDWRNPLFALTVQRITRQILAQNTHAGEVFRRLASGEALRLPPADERGHPDFTSRARIAPRARLHYMVGNHDWYYHLPGAAFDDIRREIIAAFALSNAASPFPHDSNESGLLTGLFMEYSLAARHGDIFDNYSCNRLWGRDAASLADFISCEVVFRFPRELERLYGAQIPPTVLAAVREVTHVHPALAAPLWLKSQVRALTTSRQLSRTIKNCWNEVVERFFQMEEVRQQVAALGPSEFQALRLLLTVSKNVSFTTISKVSGWLAERYSQNGRSLAQNARQESDILEKRARFVVYGHTHKHEVIALDGAHVAPEQASQVYINTGSWGTYNDLSRGTKINLLTCAALYRQDERGGRPFETFQIQFP